MNNVALTGRLTREPIIRYGGEDNSVAVAQFTLAVDGYKNTDFINCRAFGKQAEFMERWTKKGTKVELTGSIKTGSYTNRSGEKVYYTEVQANNVSFGESKAEAEQRANSVAGSGQQDTSTQDDGFMNIPDGIDDELPFK